MNANHQSSEAERLQEADIEDLMAFMRRELSILREMLSNLESEHQALLISDTARMKGITESRDGLVDTLSVVRNERIRKMYTLSQSFEIALDTDDDLEFLAQAIDRAGGTFADLRDQMTAIGEKVEDYGQRNAHLLHHRLDLTKELMARLQKGGEPSTYGQDGSLTGRQQKISVTLINREG